MADRQIRLSTISREIEEFAQEIEDIAERLRQYRNRRPQTSKKKNI